VPEDGNGLREGFPEANNVIQLIFNKFSRNQADPPFSFTATDGTS
jgi:hypothetical protein